MSETETKANDYITQLIEDTRAKCRVEYAAEAAKMRNAINEAQAEFVDKIETAFEDYFHMLETGEITTYTRRKRGPTIASYNEMMQVLEVLRLGPCHLNVIRDSLAAEGAKMSGHKLAAALRQLESNGTILKDNDTYRVTPHDPVPNGGENGHVTEAE